MTDDKAASKDAATFDPDAPAELPVGVPELPGDFRRTTTIETLQQKLLHTSKPTKVGFWGMGGIGKTLTGAAIVRNDAVRDHFDAIVWLPLGQTPVISKLQNLCHMQCAGKELASELSLEEKQQALQHAMSGKRLLLVLDDLWEEAHESPLNFVDVSAGSKVLISTRVQGLPNSVRHCCSIPALRGTECMVYAASR